jgi:methyl coenzyme M reductase subunit C-like uncharacterized protein (methanogenesis marker protein 7)
MPLISSFYGILIYIYSEEKAKHHLPHFHAEYAEYTAVYDLEGHLLAGELPRKQNKYVSAWIEIHQEELKAAWTAWQKFGETIKIEGLR